MKLKENIYKALGQMNAEELNLLYEQIKHIQKTKKTSKNKKQRFTIKQIHEMTGSSESDWSDSVLEGRTERV